MNGHQFRCISTYPRFETGQQEPGRESTRKLSSFSITRIFLQVIEEATNWWME